MPFKKFGAVILLLLLCSASSWADLVISQVVDGDVWQTTIVLTNTTASPANASLSFFVETAAHATQPWNAPFLETGSTQSIRLAAGETLLLHTPGAASVLSQGWGQIIADPGVVAYAIFTKHQPGLPAQLGTAPAAPSASHMLVPFDNTSGNVASMAVVNTSAAPETIAVTFRTTAGEISQSTLANIPAQGHAAFVFPSTFASTAHQSGLAEFTSASGTFSILALSANSAGSFTTAQVYTAAGQPILGSGAPSGGGTLPAFASISITATPVPNPLNIGPSIAMSVTNPANAATFNTGSVAGFGSSLTLGYAANFGSVTVSGQTLTFSGLLVASSVMNGPMGSANITSGSVTATLSPQGSGASGTVAGTLSFVSTAGTVNQTFTGTYTATF